MNGLVDWLALFVLLFAFFLPVSISLAEPFAYLTAILWGYAVWRKPECRPKLGQFGIVMLLFAGLLLVSSVFGPNPGYSVPKCRRLILLSLIFVVGTLFRSDDWHHPRSVMAPLLFFLAGATLFGLWDMVRVPFELSQGVDLYDTGNMRDPQLYLVSLCILFALTIYRPFRCSTLVLALLWIINLGGMILHFKRGVWLAFLLTAIFIGFWTRRYRILLAVFLGTVVLLLVPQTHDRLEQIVREEFLVRTGGRYVLWTQIAPKMIADHPFGVGMRGLTYDDFLMYSEHLQPGLNHLHNNVLQVAVDAGWLGAAVWIYWMGLTWWLLARFSRKHRQPGMVLAAAGLACFAAFTGIMLNGLVEYNFGNSVVFMVIALLMGQLSALRTVDEEIKELDPAP